MLVVQLEKVLEQLAKVATTSSENINYSLIIALNAVEIHGLINKKLKVNREMLKNKKITEKI